MVLILQSSAIKPLQDKGAQQDHTIKRTPHKAEMIENHVEHFCVMSSSVHKGLMFLSAAIFVCINAQTSTSAKEQNLQYTCFFSNLPKFTLNIFFYFILNVH